LFLPAKASGMKKKPFTADLRRTLMALVSSAAAGREDLKWLDQAIRTAGYTPKGETLSAGEARRVRQAIVASLVDAESSAETPCCKACLRHAIDQLSGLLAEASPPRQAAR
jgi:hypothetical protein